MSKCIEKKIEYQISIKNNLWNALVLSIGGTLGLVFAPDNPAKIAFTGIGLLFTFIFLKGYFKRCNRIECLIRELDKQEK